MLLEKKEKERELDMNTCELEMPPTCRVVGKSGMKSEIGRLLHAMTERQILLNNGVTGRPIIPCWRQTGCTVL